MSTPTPTYTSKLQNQRVLILGGTSGIGFCVAAASIEHGATVIISGSNPTKLSSALDRLRSAYPAASTDQISGHTCDLGHPEALEPNLSALLNASTADGSSKLNHIVFTAGDAVGVTPVGELSVAAIHAMGHVRFLGPLLLAKLAPAHLAPGPASSITLTGGTNTRRPAPGWTLPATYGAAMEGMMRGLAVDLKPIRVNLVALGSVKTELWERLPGEEFQRVLERAAAGTTVGRVGRPEDTAEAYVYLMKNQFAAGSIVDSDGGRLLA